MKLALTGAHGTGKTTLTAALSEKLSPSSKVVVCREVPRLIIDSVDHDDFFRRGNNTPLRQCVIFLYQILEDYFQGIDGDVVISDRTMVDHLAYMLELFPDFPNQPEYKPIHDAIARWMNTYDLIFKIPIEFAVEDDGVREGDHQFQAAIDVRIDKLYKQFDITPTIISGTVEERAASVLSKLTST